jgi:hypothetical protein
MEKTVKILSVGNSFSVDTMQYVADIARSIGYDVTLGNLYVGGCSIPQHYHHIENDLAVYRFYTNDGRGWNETPNVAISTAVSSCDWDIISIQHGSKDGSRYTDASSYEKLVPLVEKILSYTVKTPKIAFNMTWVGEPYHHHKELASYNGDQLLVYRLIAEVMRDHIAPLPVIDILSPVGTAVQNARTTVLRDRMSRDGYHLSYAIGRYIAGLTFFRALTGADIDGVSYMPEGVSDEDRVIAIAAANAAIASPFALTALINA